MKIIKQNFDSPKNGLLVEREREREREIVFICPKQTRQSTLEVGNLIFSAANPMQFLQRIFVLKNLTHSTSSGLMLSKVEALKIVCNS